MQGSCSLRLVSSAKLAQKGEHQTLEPVIVRRSTTGGNFFIAAVITFDANVDNFALL